MVFPCVWKNCRQFGQILPFEVGIEQKKCQICREMNETFGSNVLLENKVTYLHKYIYVTVKPIHFSPHLEFKIYVCIRTYDFIQGRNSDFYIHLKKNFK